MTIRHRVPKKTKQNRIAPIPLARPEVKRTVPGGSHKYKLRTSPTDGNSPTYELTVPYFSTGTCEEWLIFRKNLNKVIKGLNLTNGSGKFELARNLLTGDALSIFDTAASPEEITETNSNFEACLDSVALAVFPTRAELYQKRYLRRSLDKPDDMTMREFMSRIQEINEYLPQFPVDYEGHPVRKLSESELVEIGEYAIAENWQDTMHLHNIDPLTVGVAEFIEFCERLETLDRSDDTDQRTETAARSKRKRIPRSKIRKSEVEDDSSGDHYCMLHGRGNHTTENCYQLKSQAKRMKISNGDGKTGNRKQYTTNKSYNRDSSKPQYSKQELNTIVNAMVKKALRGTNKRKRSVAKTEQELNQFKTLSISGSESENNENDCDSKSETSSHSENSSISDSS